MLDNEISHAEDFQISFNDAIATLRLLFDDLIDERKKFFPTGLAEILHEIKEEFSDDFKITLDSVASRRKK